jgi:hypothetical protein
MRNDRYWLRPAALGMLMALSIWGSTLSRPARALAEEGARMAAPEEKLIVYKPLPGPKKKCWIDEAVYFTYEFNEKPKLGMIILKVRVFNKKGDKIIPFAIKGRSDMPAMRGVHDSGDQDFKLSKRNDYLLPVNIVMPGDWEIRLTFYTGDKPVYYASLTFSV